ncbi:MAG: hypothetical protein GX829_07670 [Clostridium sp.]|nr:hypothetical protein [Clostridium sp.]
MKFAIEKLEQSYKTLMILTKTDHTLGGISLKVWSVFYNVIYNCRVLVIEVP